MAGPAIVIMSAGWWADQDGGSMITASYGFGGTMGEDFVGSDGSTKSLEVGTAARLTEDNAGSAWNSADSNTLGCLGFWHRWANPGTELCRL